MSDNPTFQQLVNKQIIKQLQQQQQQQQKQQQLNTNISDTEKFVNVFENASRNLQQAFFSTQALGLKWAGYLGYDAEESLQQKYEAIQELNELMEYTGEGIVGGFNDGDIGDIGLGITNAITSVLTTVVPAMLTRGVTLVPQIAAPMYTEYNIEKAKSLYGDQDVNLSIKKLLENNEDEVTTPVLLGLTAAAFERVGYKGITNYILDRAKTTAVKRIVGLVGTGNREGLTEYFQGGLNAANRSLAKQEDPIAAVYNHLTSEQALEEYLQGFVGGAGMSAGGRIINRAFRSDKDNITVNEYIDALGALQQQKVNSRTQEGKDAIDKKIINVENNFKKFLTDNRKKSSYITKEQTDELINILDTKKKLNAKLETFQNQFKNKQLTQQELNNIVEDVNNSLQIENKKINDIKIEANKKFLMDDLRISETAINKVLGLEQKTYKTKQEFLDAYNAKTGKNLTLEDMRGVDGLVVDNEIMINIEEAAQNNAVTVGSHELLHSIVKSSITGEVRNLKDKDGNVIKDANGKNIETDLTEEGAILIKDFLNTLSKKERSVVQKRIDDNYRYNRDKDGNIISEKAFEQYAEEYLNAYADAAIKNELTDSILVKIGKFLSKIFNRGNRGYKNLEFKTGEDVKAFLKAYVSDRKKGKFRQQFIEMAQEGAKKDTVVKTKRKPRYSDNQVPVKTELFKVTSDGEVIIHKATTYLDGSVKFTKKGKNDAIFVESPVKKIKPGENITPRQALNIFDEAGDKVEVGEVGDYKTVMNPKMFDRLTPDQQQRVDSKRAKKTAPKKSKTIEKKSLSSAARQQISDSIKEIGNTYSFKGGKKAWDEGGADNAIQEIKENGYLDDLIAAKFKGDRVPVDFVDKVYAELTNHIRNFNPETNDNLFGWINSQLANKAGNVFNREYKTTTEQRTAKDVDDRTKEGEVKVQVAAEEDARTKAFEEEDISPQARARKKQEQTKEKEPTKSELRQVIGIKDGSDAYNAVLETARKVLIRAYDAGKTARQIQRDLTKEASAYLFKQVKNMLGTKRNYIGNITKFRVPLINSMFTADLVQMERNVPDADRIFTRFIKNLTSKQEVQDAVDNNLLPPSALNTIDKGQSVALYEKIMPTEKQFIDFFDQPLINPKTGARSGLRGTRKDQLAKYVAASLNFDATMQVAQEPEVAEKRQQIAELRGETIDDTDIQVLSATINRDPSVKFSKNIVSDRNQAAHIEKAILGKLNTRDQLEKYIDKNGKYIVTGQGVNEKTPMSAKEKKFFVKQAFSIIKASEFETTNNEELSAKLLKRVKKAREKGIISNAGIENENKDRDLLQKYFPKTAKFLKGKGDTYINFFKSAVIFGFESKLGIAQGVSQLLSYTKKGINFPNKNQTTNNDQRLFDDIIGEKMQKAKDDINTLLKLNGIDTITDFTQKLSQEQIEVLKPFRHLFMIEETVSLRYIMSAYANGKYGGKNAQGFIIIEGKVYAMETGNKVVDDQTQELVNEFNKISDNKIEYLKLNDKASGVDVIVNMDIVDGKVKYRLRPLILSENFDASTVDINNPAIAKKLGLAAQKAATSIDLKTQAKAASNTTNIEKYSKTSRGMSAFDFDETLIDKGDNFIIATSPSGKEIKITSGQWPIKGPKLAEQGYKFDFTDFVNVRGGVDGPLLQKLRNRIEKYGAQNNYILTARPPESATAIHGWLKTKGINIPIENITGLGNSTGEAKALWITGKYAEGYNDIYFVDDALPNVKAVADVINQLDIKGKSVQAKVKFSKSINDQFNDIIEDTTGVDSQKRFSDVQANLRSRKGKYFNLVPPSAQDFMGLLYNFLGKGRVGEKQFEFFKKTLIDPFAKGINELNTARQRTMEKYKELVKSLPKVKKQLTTELKKFENIPDYIKNYNVDQAVRVYLWNKNGIEVPGMTKRDAKALTEFVENNPDIKAFADAVGTISKEQQSFTAPNEYWLTENIKSDLFSDGALGDVRSKYLAEWQLNIDQMFNPENMNKIKVIYGTKFVEALKDVLYRMKTGRNRPTNKSRLTNEFMNWVNGSIGAIMFFNIRSAVLQTISSINYINWSDNNPLKAAAAFANQKQFWSDFVFLFNSDFLKQRRAGNQRGVNEQELSEAVTGKGAYEQAKAAIRYLLKIGFLPTQLADSFAIASGGATFYRNRVNKYMKDGMSKFEAENQAFLDFQEITEVSQQSARPDLISQQQADALGRMILSFQNTPMQYGRIIDKAFRDIINRRGDTKTHVSKIAYYGVVQGILFTALQSALFATMGDEDDEAKEKKKERMLNSIVDSWLSTFGYGGKGVATVKNTMLEYQKQRAKDLDEEFMTRPDHTYTILTALSFSPPIGSKLRKIYSSIQTERFNRDIMKERGFKVDNPAFSAIGNVIEAVTNLPLARLSNKLRNLENALDSRNETWQRVALALGWNTWDLGIKDQDIEALGENIKERKKQEKAMDKIKKKYPGKTQEEIDIVIKEKEVFDLSKREQENIIKQNNLNPKDYKLEKDRVSIIMKLRNKDAEKIDKQLTNIKNYKPSKSEQREIDLFKMNKKDQVNLLLDFGLTNKQIKALKYEEDRVKKIIELEEKSKNR